jgi:hypothetical protein
VWVHELGCWRPAVVLHASARAVTVRYRPAEGRGTGVDTVTCHNLAARDDDDPYLDPTTGDGPTTGAPPDALPPVPTDPRTSGRPTE